MKRILIIDDTEDYSENLRFILALNGYSVMTATNGHEGLQMALANKPYLTLMDLIMPGQDGASVIRLSQ